MDLGKYSIGMGDRFGQQGEAQLRAVLAARQLGVQVTPVWNKSHREHTLLGSGPASVRGEAEAATRALGWNAPWHVEADHIGLATVDGYLADCDMFTIDVTGAIGRPAGAAAAHAFKLHHQSLIGPLRVPGLAEPLEIDGALLDRVAAMWLEPIGEAARVCERIEAARGAGNSIIELAIDETDTPLRPEELFFILKLAAEAALPLQTIAPRFCGRFNKGIDYRGDVTAFERAFRAHVAVLALARDTFGLPGTLKLSVHSGSDKFSLYGPMRRVLRDFDAGVHLKTAGTTWLEELAALAVSGDAGTGRAGEGLELAREIYAEAYARREELCEPYAQVIEIDAGRLPDPAEVARWDAARFARAVRHEPGCAEFSAEMRQLLHVAYPLAAQRGAQFVDALQRHREVIGPQVMHNLLDRHIRPLFVGK